MIYDFGCKRNYRREIYGFANQCLAAIPINERRVVYLDTSQALETEFLLKKGYNPKLLYPCNFNPAEAAWISRKFPEVKGHIYGRDIFDIISWLHDNNIQTHIVHLDFCSPVFTQEFLDRHCFLITMVDLILAQQYESVLIFNFLRGRDTLDPRTENETFDEARLELLRLITASMNTWSHHKSRIYKSMSGQTMIWFAKHIVVDWKTTRCLQVRNYIKEKIQLVFQNGSYSAYKKDQVDGKINKEELDKQVIEAGLAYRAAAKHHAIVRLAIAGTSRDKKTI